MAEVIHETGEKHDYTKSQIPCSMTLITCYKNCKECISQNYATITTQNCTLCIDNYIFFENTTTSGCCFNNKTEIDGYYIDFEDLKYKKCHEFCLLCKNSSTYCLKCKLNYVFFNFKCLKNCPIDSHRSEDGNYCICNYKFFIDESNIIHCLNKDENCSILYPFLLNNTGECLKECNEEYPFSFNNNCLKKCLNNSY